MIVLMLKPNVEDCEMYHLRSEYLYLRRNISDNAAFALSSAFNYSIATTLKTE